HPRGIELFVNKNTYGPHYWQNRYNYPDIGISLSYFDHNSKVLGKNIATIIYMDFIMARRKRSEVLFKIGTGLVYTTNPFDKEHNYKNNALSSWLSYAMQGRLGYNYKISDRLKLNTGLTLTHFSNGGFKIPNSGINIVSFNAGISHMLDLQTPPYSVTTEIPELEKEIKFNLSLASGFKGLHDLEGYFPFLNVSAYFDKRLSYSSALNLGVDGFYNLAIKNEIIHSQFETLRKPDFKKVGLVAGHELFVGKISMLTQFGVYLYNPFKSTIPVYQRYGIKYYFKEDYFLGLNLKSHGGRADVMEWAVGLRI
nr:acyloxyacyl hydrolase [Bacteroidota bacterium]